MGYVPLAEHWLRQSPLSPDLAERLRRLTGEDVIDCGLEVTPSFTDPGFSPFFVHEAFDCANATRASGRPFHLLLQQRSVGSTVVTGLVGTSAGTVSRFSYDSAPCGGPGCAPVFAVHPCEHPAMVERHGTFDVVCERPVASPKSPSARERDGRSVPTTQEH